MKELRIAAVMGHLREDLVSEAVVYSPVVKKYSGLYKYIGIAAACLCLIGGLWMIRNNMLPDHSNATTPAILYTLSEPEEMVVELVGYERDRLFAVVVDAGNNSVYPLGAKLGVVFETHSEIFSCDGTQFVLDLYEMSAKEIGWEIGTTVRVKFTNHFGYAKGNGFYNMLLADRVEEIGE